MKEPIKDFVKLFGAKLSLNKGFIIEKENRYFLLNRDLKKFAERKRDWYFAGTYLGRIKDGKFTPSFPLLSMIAKKAKNKIIVDDGAAWLFVCGRDIFKEGIVKAFGSKSGGAYTLVLNRHGECIGFGRILRDLDEIKGGVAVKNVLDIGDFLRRERIKVH